MIDGGGFLTGFCSLLLVFFCLVFLFSFFVFWIVAVPMKTVSIPNDLPEEFDGRTDDAWFGCVHEIRDQGRCGS